ncbi:MAG: proton-conducting transporter membrane subunit, partial [Planctomycetaceae bacterium]
MDIDTLLPTLLGLAWLLPLASFVVILFAGPRLGHHGKGAATVATAAIVGALALSLVAFVTWLANHPVGPAGHAEGAGAAHASADGGGEHAGDHADDHAAAAHGHEAGPHYSGDWYTLYEGGRLRLSIGWYIDSLTVLMFVMITFIATCIHVYASGYMHDELHDVTDHEVRLAGGGHLHRPGRYPRFFQALSLFCFSMLGIVIAGNLAMVFVFWELVGICSWFLIGFYYERSSASTAANKAFIVNRVGDFGML